MPPSLWDATPVCADWIHDAVAGWRGPNLTETPDLVPFDQPQQGVLLQLQEAEPERAVEEAEEEEEEEEEACREEEEARGS